MVAARLLLPRRQRGRDDGTIVWRRPTAAAISSLLHNPAYAGTFAYGERLLVAPIDAWVVQNFWEALSPAELDCYDQAVAAFDEQHRQIERARQQQLERLRYEARLAEKQYRLVDAENRLVAAELERRWEQALQALRQGEEQAESP